MRFIPLLCRVRCGDGDGSYKRPLLRGCVERGVPVQEHMLLNFKFHLRKRYCHEVVVCECCCSVQPHIPQDYWSIRTSIQQLHKNRAWV
jgi:hypothetical protein